MNHIYKVIWSKAKHTYVVVSEIAKNHSGKAAGKRAIIAAVLTALALTGAVLPAEAAGAQNGKTTEEALLLLAQNEKKDSADAKAAPEEGTTTEANAQETVYNENGFYAKQDAQTGHGTYNSLTKDGLWVGGDADNTGFHVDNDGNAVTTGTVRATDFILDVPDLFTKDVYTNSFLKAGLVPGQTNSDYSTAIGQQMFGNPSIDTNSGMSVSIGDAATIGKNAERSTALGYNSKISDSAKQSVALGSSSAVDKAYGVAIGESAAVQTQNGIAIGQKATIQKGAVNSVAIGGLYEYSEEDGLGGGGNEMVAANAKNSTVVGAATLSQAAGGSAFGKGARVGQNSDDSTAIGVDATVQRNTKNAVALGAGSVADEENTVSVGSEDNQRKIVNVADGVNEYDAVNKGQLDAVKGVADNAVQYDKNTDGTSSVTFNGSDGTTLKNVQDVEIKVKGGSRGLVASGITPGKVYADAKSWAEDGAADTGSLAIGGGQVGSQTSSASVRGKNSVAIGAGASVTVENAEELPGFNNFDQANGTALGVGANVTGIQGTAVGYGSKVQGNQSTALGEQSSVTGKKSTAVGESAVVSADNATALGQGASVGSGADKSVALGADSTVFSTDLKPTDKNGVVSVGSGNEERRIIHVADGIDANDAVNKGQLDAVDTKVTGLSDSAIQYDTKDDGTTDYNSVTLKGKKWQGTDIKNVGDIVLAYKTTYGQDASFAKAGITPGLSSDLSKDGIVSLRGNATDTNAIAIGTDASASKLSSVAIGKGATSQSEYGIAIGEATWIDSVDQNAAVKGDIGSVAIGAGSTVTQKDTENGTVGVVSVGSGDKDSRYGATRKIINVSDGEADSDAATVGQVKAVSKGFSDAGIVAGSVGKTKNSLAVGKYSEVQGNNSTAVGQSAKVYGDNGAAFGNGASIYDNAGVAVGQNSTVSNVNGTALGTSTAVQADNGTALGYGAKVYGANSTALGKDSYVAENDVTATDENGVISVGRTAGAQGTDDKGFTRRIINVADGTIAEGSHDVVTGGQLYPIKTYTDALQKAGIVGGKTGDTFNHQTALGEESFAFGNNATALGYNSNSWKENGTAVGANSSVEGVGGVAVGYNAQAWGTNGVALGTNSYEKEDGAIAIGNESKNYGNKAVSIGTGSVVTGDNSVALGNGSVATEKNVVSVGSTGSERKVVNVADGTISENSHDAVTGGQLYTEQQAREQADQKLSDAINGYKGAGLAAGTTENASGSIALGEKSAVKNAGGSIAIGNATVDQTGLTTGSTGVGPWNGIAIGGDSTKVVKSANGIALGAKASVENSNWGTALGAGSTVKDSEESLAIGHNAKATDKAYKSAAIGYGAIVDGSYQSAAFGIAAQVKGATDATAIGTTSFVSADGYRSTALGSYSVADESNVISVGHAKGDKDAFGYAYDSDLFRKITNVADGVGDHDAVTVGQLKKSGIVTGTAKDDGTALGSGAEANNAAIAIGKNAKATGGNSIAIGVGSTASGVNSTALGLNSVASASQATALGQNAQALAEQSVALGEDSVATEKGTVSVGNDTWLKRRITNVADGTAATDAATVGQMTKADQLVKDTVTSAFDSKFDALKKALSDGGNDTAANTLAVKDLTTAGIKGGTVTNGEASNIALGAGASISYDANYGKDENGQVIQWGTGPWNAVAIGNGSEITNSGNGIVIGGGRLGGITKVVNSYNGIAIGVHNTVDNSASGVVIGSNASIHNSTDSVALGSRSIAVESNVVSVGRQKGDPDSDGDPSSYTLTRRIVNVGAGINAFDAVNVGQFNGWTSKGAGTGTYAGGASFLNAVGKIDWAKVAEKSDAINSKLDSLDSNQSTTNKAAETKAADTASTVKLDTKSLQNAKISLASAVKPTLFAATDVAAEGDKDEQRRPDGGTTTGGGNKPQSFDKGISVKGESTFEDKVTFQKGLDVGKNKITGLAEGTASGDAVNFDQFDRFQKSTDTQFSVLNGRVNDLGDEIDSVGAISAALAGLHPIDYDPTGSKYQLSAALGTYDGSSAFALGGFYNVNKDTLLSAGVSTVLKGERKTSANLGVTFRVGAGNSAAENTAATDLAEANQRLAALSQDNRVLEGQNRKLTEKVDAQDQKLAEQDQKLADLEAKLNALLAAKK